MKALLIIAPNRFRDEEYFHTKEELENAGIEVVTTSRNTDLITGMLGGTTTPDIDLADVDVNEYDAVVFIGGSGASAYFDDPLALEIARSAYDSEKVVGAICIAPSILANAGVLKGKRATAFGSEEGNLREKGAVWTGDGVVIDGRIVTANGPANARNFGRTLARLINK